MAGDCARETALTQLLDRARGGSDGDRERLVESVYQRLNRLCRSLLSRYPGVACHEQTGDVMGQVWPRLLGELSARQFENSAHFFSFSATLIRNTLVDLLRKHRGRNGDRPIRYEAPSGAPEPCLEVEEPGESPDQDLLRGEIHVLIGELEPAHREMFGLRFYHGLKEEECARLLGLDERTVRRRWRSARMALADLLEE